MPISPKDLVGHSIVAVGDSAGAQTLTLTDQRGRTESQTVSVTIRSSEYASAMRLVAAGGGIGALPDIIARSGLDSGKLERVLPEWNFASAKLHAISIAGHEAPARVRAFREFIRERLAADCP